MEILQATEMTDEQWKLYEVFYTELNRKFYSEDSNKISDWQDLKRNRLSDLEFLRDDYLSFYLFIESEKAVGWIGIRLSGDGAEFSFDILYEEVSENILRNVFEIVNQFMSERNSEEIITYTKRENIVKAMEGAGGKIFDSKIFARIKRVEIDKYELQNTTELFTKKYNYKLVFYDTIHEEIIDRYLEIYNEARIDMNRYNPGNPAINKRTKEDVYKKLKWDKGPRDKMYMYVLFDNKIIAGFCSLFVRDENKNMIDQAGGLTTVNRNYRGQNIAKFLKATMYLKMLEEYPEFEFIRTDTYPWNKYMFRINEEMGFKPYEEYFEIKFIKKCFENYLNN